MAGNGERICEEAELAFQLLHLRSLVDFILQLKDKSDAAFLQIRSYIPFVIFENNKGNIGCYYKN